MHQNLNLRGKTIKFLEENMGNLHDIGFIHDFLNMTAKAQATKDKIDQLDFIKVKNVLAS